jgi:threonine aldolase
MRQAGFLAAAGIYALDHNIERLKEDHKKAKHIASVLSGLSYIEEVIPAETNILIFKIPNKISNSEFLQKLDKNGIKAIGFGPQLIRFVTHLDYTDDMLIETENVLKNKMF